MAERRYTLVFYAAVITAAVATYGVYRVLEVTKERSRVPMQQVVVASQDVPEGASLDRMVLTVNNWPVPTVPAGAYGSLDSVAGRVTRVAVFKGEPIVPGRLAPEGTGPGLEVKITPGKRAMGVRVDDVSSISGLLQPNSRVDVLVTLQDNSNSSDRQKQISKLFMENMRVLSVGTQVQRGPDNQPISAPTVTLEVTPDEAERLAIAQREGSIQLVLRGYGDPDSTQTKGARSNEVLGQLSSAPTVRSEPARPSRPAPARSSRPAAPVQQAVVAPPPPPRRSDSLTVQVFRGNAVSQQKFEKKDSTAVSATTP
jgi:pilus assembly protein CpaB